MSETVKQATITVTFYYHFGNEPIEQLKKKYVVQNWQTEDDLRRLLDEIAAEMNYISGYGIKSIAAAAEYVKFTLDYGNRFMPYGKYSERAPFMNFFYSLKFEVGNQISWNIKRIWFEIPRVETFNGYMDPTPRYNPDDRLFQIKLEGFHKSKELYLRFDHSDPILLSFLHKIYEGEILFPDIRKEWRHDKRKACDVKYIRWAGLPETQTTQYQYKKAAKQQKIEERKRKLQERHENQTKKLLKKHGIVVDEPQPKAKPTQVYIIEQRGEHGFSSLYKIGISKSPQKRLQALKTSNPFELKIVHTFAAEPAEDAEAQLHAKYEHIHQKGEWFKLSPEQLAELQQIHEFRHGQFLKGEVTGVE